MCFYRDKLYVCVFLQQLAIEVVLTLGQAFEVAYQLAVQQNGIEYGDPTQNRPVSDNFVKDPPAVNNHISSNTADISGLAIKL